MPVFDVSERHELRVRADPARTYQAIRRVDLAHSLPVRILFGVRRIPRWFASRPPHTMTLDDFVRAGFFILAEKPGVEIVLGVIGQFWRPAGAVLHVDPSEFASFERPGYAKAAWNFHIDRSDGGFSFVSTETRVLVPDDASRRKFRLYWWFIDPFSGFIRRRALALVKVHAEKGWNP